MKTENLFYYDWDSDPHSYLKGYLNCSHWGQFFDVIDYFIDKKGLGLDDSFIAEFYNDPDEDEEDFEGIRIRNAMSGKEIDTAVFSFSDALPIVLEAIDRYIQLYPESAHDMLPRRQRLIEAWS